EVAAERIDRHGFSGTRRAGNAKPYRLAGKGKQALHQGMSSLAEIGAFAFHHGNSPRTHRPVAFADHADKTRTRQVARANQFCPPRGDFCPPSAKISPVKSTQPDSDSA